LRPVDDRTLRLTGFKRHLTPEDMAALVTPLLGNTAFEKITQREGTITATGVLHGVAGVPEGAEAAHYEAVPLARQGKLWSYTVQGFRPKSPPYAGADDERSFKPFALGYVELPSQVIVETRIETDAPQDLKIGQPMALCLQTFKTAPNGEDRLTFAFRPMAH
jgi:uncharacterized OB-fold protein